MIRSGSRRVFREEELPLDDAASDPGQPRVLVAQVVYIESRVQLLQNFIPK